VARRALRKRGEAVVAAAALTGLAVAVRASLRWARRWPLAGARVLITGGSRGLGLVLAREFGRQGARLAICARDVDELDRAGRDLQGRGLDVVAVPCDVRVRGQVENMVRSVAERMGGIDILVNNAGIIQVGPLDTLTLADYEDAMAANFWAAVYVTHAILPLLRRQGGGRIVNISSIGGKVSVPHMLSYSASKFALTGWSEGLRAELAREGILVTTVCPGLMRTGSPRNATFKGEHRAEYAWFSVSDALPGLSVAAERAARAVIAACRAGEAEVVLTVPAKVAVKVHGLFPGLTAGILGLLNRLLPGPGGVGQAGVRGSESESRISPSWLTTLGDEAARRNNEIPGPRTPGSRPSSLGDPSPRHERRPGRPGLVIGPTTGGPDVGMAPESNV
jgi:NAD(P)-dependent dehydrogenase (short-subunit alcohol dehydrogenase family)